MRDYPALLEYVGALGGYGYVEFAVKFQQTGDPDSWGSTRPHFTPEDAAYAALTMIEEHEREVYETNLVMGLA